MTITLRPGLYIYKGQFIGGHSDTRNIAFIAINVAEQEGTRSKKSSVVFNVFADDGHCVVQGKSIICTVEKIENCPLEKINNKDCLCVVFKEKILGNPGNTYGSAIIQLNEAGELTEGEYWTNGGTSWVITDLKLQDLKDEK